MFKFEKGISVFDDLYMWRTPQPCHSNPGRKPRRRPGRSKTVNKVKAMVKSQSVPKLAELNPPIVRRPGILWEVVQYLAQKR